MALASLPATVFGGTSVILTSLIRGGVIWAGASTVSSMDHYSRLTAQEVDAEIAAYGAIARGSMIGLEIALPIFRAKSIMTVIALNGGGNIAIGQLSVAVQNAVLGAYPEHQREQWNLEQMTVDGLLGASLGLIYRRMKMRSAPVGQAPIEGVSSTEVKGLPAPKGTPESFAASPLDQKPFDFDKAMSDKKLSDENLSLVLSSKTPVEIETITGRIVAHNVEAEKLGILKLLGQKKLDEFLKIKSIRGQDNWLDDNLTGEQEQFLNKYYINEDLAKEFNSSSNDFDVENGFELGKSIAFTMREIEKEGFETSPKGIQFRNAIAYSIEQGFSEKEVLRGMRQRSVDHAGDDAPELFGKIWDKIKKTKKLSGKKKLRTAPPSDDSLFPNLNELKTTETNVPTQQAIPNVPRPKKSIPVNSPAEAQKVANPKKATDETVRIIKENDVEAANAITDGVGMGALANDNILPNFKVDPNLNLPAARKLIEEVKANDYIITESMKDSQTNPLLQNPTERSKLMAQALQLRADVQSGPVWSQADSSVPIEGINFQEGREIYIPRKGGTYKMTKSGEPSPAAERELAKLQARVDESSLRGLGDVHFVQKDQGWVIEHTWKKEYIDTWGVLGIDKVHLLGVEATGLARTVAGPFLIPTPANKRMGDPHTFGIEQEAKIANTLDRIAAKSIDKLKHKIEFHNLINHGMENGIDQYSIKDIYKMYSKTLTWKQAEKVYESHKKWRRSTDYLYAMAARQHRTQLANEGWRGVRKTGNMNSIMLATTKIPDNDLASLKKGDMNVLNYEANISERYRPTKGDERTLVRLREPLEVGGSTYTYATFGPEMKLGILPDVTLPRLKGWSPRFYKENFFIDAIPKSKMVNGRALTTFNELAEYKTTVAGARTLNEANEIAARMYNENKEFTFVPRRERGNKLKQITEQLKVASDSADVERRRGQEQLTDGYGKKLRIGDHWESMKRTNQTLAHVEAFDAVDRILQHDFIATHKEYLAKGTFPEDSSEIRIPANSDKPLEELEIGFKEALRNFEYYRKQKVLKTMGDFNFEGLFHGMADVFESFSKNLEKSDKALIAKIAKDLPDALRMFGNEGNLLLGKWPKSSASMLMIAMNPLRQLMIQPQQAREMWFVNPSGAIDSLRLMYAVRAIYLFSPEPDLPSRAFVRMVGKTAGLSEEDMLREFHNVRKSGLFDGLNRHELIRDMLLEAEEGLNDSGIKTTSRLVKNTVTAIPTKFRKYGFEIGERSNRLGMYFQARDILRKKYPERDWSTPENLAIIAVEGNKLSGNMNRAGSLPYQHGMLSTVLQFQAIPHKMFFNMVQDTATVMDPKMRSKVFGTRLAMYGLKRGGILAGVGLAVDSVYEEMTGDVEPWLMDFPELRYFLMMGGMDWSWNKMINLAFYEEGELDKNGNIQVPTNMAFGESMSPSSKNSLIYIDIVEELAKLLDKDASTNPRFAMTSIVSRFEKTARDWNRIWGKTNEGAPTIDKLKTLE